MTSRDRPTRNHEIDSCLGLGVRRAFPVDIVTDGPPLVLVFLCSSYSPGTLLHVKPFTLSSFTILSSSPSPLVNL